MDWTNINHRVPLSLLCFIALRLCYGLHVIHGRTLVVLAYNLRVQEYFEHIGIPLSV